LGADTFKEIPTGTMGLYFCFECLAQRLRQLMIGNRKFTMDHNELENELMNFLSALSPWNNIMLTRYVIKNS
jgi:hypothetical protein